VSAERAHAERRVATGRVVAALVVTVVAAGIELVGSWTGQSLFLVADAVHLLAHVGIFGVLLLPRTWWQEGWEDASAVAVLGLVGAIAAGVIVVSAHALAAGRVEPPEPALMLLSLVGLAANVTAAWLLTAPARRWWSFRAALAHELSDGAMTVGGLFGAGAIALFGWAWVDPALSLGVGTWLAWWVLRLLVRRIRRGAGIWAEEPT